MTEKELINYLSSYERFIDDDYGGYYESIIQFSDGKLERALTSMSALRIIDEFNKLQQENQELKAKIKTYEDPEDLTLMFMYCNEKAKDKIQELKKQLEELEKQNFNLREYIMTNKMAIPYEEIKDKSLYDLYTIPSYSDLSKENQELKKQLKIKHNGFMASVDESCDLAKENQKYKEVIDKAIMYVNSTRYSDINGLQKYSIKEFWFIKELEDILKEVE